MTFGLSGKKRAERVFRAGMRGAPGAGHFRPVPLTQVGIPLFLWVLGVSEGNLLPDTVHQPAIADTARIPDPAILLVATLLALPVLTRNQEVRS